MKSIRTICKNGIVLALLIASVEISQASLVRPWGDAGTLSDLQHLFNSIGSSIDVINDQTTETLFEPTGAGNSVASYVATVTWGLPELEFGIYNTDDPNQTVPLFYESIATAGGSIVVQFNQGADFVRVVDLNTLSVLASTTYFKEFGFYTTAYDSLGGIGSGPHYSEDHLNTGGQARFLTYEGKGDNITMGTAGTYSDIDHWYVAAEATPGSTDSGDFDDFLVQMESITPIPEPASIGLIALCSGCTYFIRRMFPKI